MIESLTGRAARAGSWLRRRAENIAVLLLATMFAAFIIQILFRYVFNWPVGWASEVTVVCWIWLVLWGAAFVVRERDEIRFDVIFGSVPPRVRRGMAVVTALVLVGLYGWSFPAVWDYVTFMKVQRTAYLGVRYDHLYAIYIVFAVAVILRYLWLLWRALRGADSDPWAGGDEP